MSLWKDRPADDRAGLSAETREVLDGARRQAAALGQSFVAPVHVVLAALAGDDVRLSRELGIERSALRRISQRIRNTVERVTAPRAEPARLPWTSWTKLTIETARIESRLQGRANADPVHLILAILHHGFDPAGTLATEGLTIEHARRAVGRVEGKGSTSVSGFRFEIRDDSPDLIYEQLVRQVLEAIATRRLETGDRLPTVRALSDELDLAPGTVARAYTELERMGAVVTAGGRGTTIAGTGLAEPPRAYRAALFNSLRDIVVAAFHQGVGRAELRRMLADAQIGIY